MFAPLPALAPDSPILTRLAQRLPQIIEELYRASLDMLPETSTLPKDHFEEILVPNVYAGAVGFLRALDEQRPYRIDEVREFVTPIVETLAEERLPLQPILTGFHGSVRRLWNETLALTENEDLADLAAFSNHLLELLMNVTTLVTATYAAVEQSVYGLEREARRSLCVALLRGAPAGELAARADHVLAEHYDVLAVTVAVPAMPGSVALAENAVARRRVRIIQQVLDEIAGTTALSTFDGASGIALLPRGSTPGPRPEYDRAAAKLTGCLDGAVHIGECAVVSRALIPEKATQAMELAQLAEALGQPAGIYRLDDLLLEYQLTRPGEARDRLAQRIIPILDQPHLLEAVDVHIKHGADRKAAAALLHVHPNTLSYRLRRVTEITGIDPSDPHGSRLIAAALMVQRLYPSTD
ncbi:helix-turn-helix domain-containing protein [Nocardia sp. NPDC006630]|uniref:PucR family transcriptional regulator n=1 Tax=Nocardia sp. NPDC006630 TaxID=3157181 RepID=UPI0033ACE286